MFYVMSKQFIILKSIFIQFCKAKLILRSKHAEWPMNDYSSKYLPFSLCKLTVVNSSLTTVHSKSVWCRQFFQTLGIYSKQFLRENCPLGSFFSYFFVNISSWSNIQHALSPFKVYWRWWWPQFFQIQEEKDLTPWDQKWANPPQIMVYVLHDSSTYFPSGSISYWMLSLVYWKLGQVLRLKTTLQSIWNTMRILLLVEFK